MTYWLAPHVFVRPMAAGAICLDIRQDRYFSVGLQECSTLAYVVADWPAEPPATQAFGGDASNAPIVKALLQRRALIPERPPTRIAPVSVGAPRITRALSTAAPWSEATSSPHVQRFIRAVLSARLSLRLRPLTSIVGAIHARKALAASDATRDETELAELVGIFRRLRPLAFTAKDQCLLHALALVYFLAAYDAFPSWVIGVKTDPWGAHTWVQEGDRVLDTVPEKVLPFSPILVI